MTKKDRYFRLRQSGLPHPEAAQKAKITNRQVRYRYGREYDAFLKGWNDAASASASGVDPEETLFHSLPPADRAAFLTRPGDHTDSLTNWISAGKPRQERILAPLPSGHAAGQGNDDRVLNRLVANEGKNHPNGINKIQTSEITEISCQPPSIPEPQPPVPDQNPNPLNVTGDPFSRPDWPVNPQAHWDHFREQQEQAEAARRWAERQNR